MRKILIAACLLAAMPAAARTVAVEERSIDDLRAMLASGKAASADPTRAYLKLGLSFLAPRLGEATVLGAGYAYEQRAHARVAPTYRATVDEGAALEGMG